METDDRQPPTTESVTSLSAAQRALVYVGSIGPLGFLPASGTIAVAVAGVPLAWLLTSLLPAVQYAVFLVAFSAASVLLHGWGDRVLGESDSRKLVWDELAGFFLAVFMVPMSLPGWPIVVIAFFFERIIDIAKVPPANIIDRKMHSGLGVVLDDLVAGAYTCVILHLLMRYGPAWLT